MPGILFPSAPTGLQALILPPMWRPSRPTPQAYDDHATRNQARAKGNEDDTGEDTQTCAAEPSQRQATGKVALSPSIGTSGSAIEGV